jgi:F0F1-type ATP synthase membrane subunit c/vacuolar-type H+-ATPase subunit K
MLALGSVLAGIGVLLVGLLALLFRNPRAPRWTRPEAVVFLTMVPVAGMIGVGFGFVLYGGSALLHGEGDLRELAAPALVPVVVALVWHALGIRGRLRAYAEAGPGGPSSVVAMPGVALAGSIEEPPESPAPGKPPRRPTRKAA